MNQNDTAPETDEPDLDGEAAEFDGPLIPEPPHPINWNLLTSEEAEAEWLELNRWVDWLRRTYGLPASVVPPFWHRHPELLWELSALHLHWLSAYDPEQKVMALNVSGGEIGYIAPGQGRTLGWAFEALGWSEVIHNIDIDNRASQRVAEKLGSGILRRIDNEVPFEGYVVDVWGQSRERWLARQSLT